MQSITTAARCVLCAFQQLRFDMEVDGSWQSCDMTLNRYIHIYIYTNIIHKCISNRRRRPKKLASYSSYMAAQLMLVLFSMVRHQWHQQTRRSWHSESVRDGVNEVTSDYTIKSRLLPDSCTSNQRQSQSRAKTGWSGKKKSHPLLYARLLDFVLFTIS